MNKRNSKLITNKFFVPTILMNASISLSIIIDSIIVRNVLSSSELVAINLILPVSLCISTFSEFLGIGGSNLIVAQKGKMNNENVNKTVIIFPFIIKADGNPKLCSAVLVIANVINLFMDIVYMKYMNMGLAGGALATITGYIVVLLIFLLYLKSPKRTLHIVKIKLENLKHYINELLKNKCRGSLNYYETIYFKC